MEIKVQTKVLWTLKLIAELERIPETYLKHLTNTRGLYEIDKLIMKKKNLTALADFINQEIGPRGSKKREKFEKGYESFKLGALIHEARQKKGLTQEQVAALSGTNKSYISKLEKDLKDVRFSTLQRIVREGLGGKLEVSIIF